MVGCVRCSVLLCAIGIVDKAERLAGACDAAVAAGPVYGQAVVDQEVAGFGWEGDAFSSAEIDATRAFLHSRAITIYGGTNEIQMNIVAKRVLGLPD